MSRVGKYPVTVPVGVVVTLEEGRLTVRGRRGVLSLALRSEVAVVMENGKILVRSQGDLKPSGAMWGTTRANIHNAIVGVDRGFSKRLDIVGVGYKAVIQENALTIALGFSHDIVYPIPSDVLIQCDSPTTLTISGPSKERVGQIAAEIRSYRPPEPYKGKGIRYADEQILRKEGKKK